MRQYKQLILWVFLICVIIVAEAQQQSPILRKRNFNDAKRFILFSNYTAALPLLLNLQRADTLNANLNYLAGLCYLNSSFEKEKSISYFKAASQNMSPKYKELRFKEKKSPYKTIYHLGQAYQFAYQFDKADNYFVKYKELVFDNAKELRLADRYIEMCKNGEALLKNPIEITIDNLGGVINSDCDEHTPCITADEKTLIFTSRRRGSTGGTLTDDGRYFEDIYISKKVNEQWTAPQKISTNINTNGHEATIGVSPDGQELYIYKDDNGIGNIYFSRFENKDWTIPEKVGSNINTSANETHATISSDGTTLIFISDRDNGKGGKDLYVVHRLPDGEWGLAQNMGDVLNTPYDEEGPFLHPDGYTLYFSSKGHNSMGGYDLFYSELQNDSIWGAPVNMGYPINTTVDDVYYVLSANGKRAYFSSIRKDGFGGRDLYVMNLLSLPERSSAVIKGNVQMEGTAEIPKNIIINVRESDTGKMVGRYKPNKESGYYIIILRQGKDYTFTCESPDLIFYPEKISIPTRTAFTEINKPIILNPIGVVKKK